MRIEVIRLSYNSSAIGQAGNERNVYAEEYESKVPFNISGVSITRNPLLRLPASLKVDAVSAPV